MRIVLDTNVFLVCISSKSKYHWIFEALLNNKFTLCLSTDILFEYEEIIEQHMGFMVKENTMALIEYLPNISKVDIFFKFDILDDAEDNKFIDCAVAANADYIVTQDKDFNSLKTITFPEVNIVDIAGFRDILAKQ